MDYSNRIKKLRENLSKLRLDGVLVSSVANITHLTGYSNFSIHEREAYLLITQGPQFILTDDRYSEAVKRQIPGFELMEVSSKNPSRIVLRKLARKLSLKRVGVEENNLTVKEYKTFEKIFKKLVGFKAWKTRAIKDEYEIEQIERACKLGDEGFDFLLTKIKPGISEKMLAFELDSFIKRKGGDLSFETIVAFSKNSSMPHHQTGNDILSSKAGQFVLLDFGVRVNNYCSDMTRTVFFSRASEKQKKIYQTVMTAQKLAADFLRANFKAGVKASEVDNVARQYILAQGFASIPHSLGHGIGVEVHEHPFLSPKSNELLKTGMVFSIEPGVYEPDFGGVRIEDLFVLGEDRLRRITRSASGLTQL